MKTIEMRRKQYFRALVGWLVPFGGVNFGLGMFTAAQRESQSAYLVALMLVVVVGGQMYSTIMVQIASRLVADDFSVMPPRKQSERVVRWTKVLLLAPFPLTVLGFVIGGRL